jgi:hypothetical protein
MAPKPANKGKRTRLDAGQGSVNNLVSNFAIARTNRYLFRDTEAYTNYVGMFESKTLTKCYYFDKSTQTFSLDEDQKIMEYLDHWKWDSFLKINEPYDETITKAFYANLKISESPFLYSSYVCGKEIVLSLQNLANWLELPNEGEETYILRNWPRGMVETADHYKRWFKCSIKPGDYLYMTHLPSLHKLLFLLINNILVPKASIKTNMERGPMFYLRHLITLDQEKKFNIPFIILNHMKSALSSKVACLPYAHLIHRILRLNGINLVVEHQPIHLIDLLPKYGWRLGISHSGLPHLRPDARPINNWINHPNARPNQYQDPNVQAPVQMEYEPAGDVPPQAGQGDIPQILTQQMAQMIEQMKQLNDNQTAMSKRILRMSVRIKKNTETIKSLDEVQTDLVKRCVRYFGASNASSSQASQDDDDDEDDEDGDDEDNVDEEDVDPNDGIAPN